MSTSRSAGRRKGESVGAATAWYICGKCGFKNHPRLNQDGTKCEQCGADATKDGAARDYDPALSPGVA